MTWTPCAVRPYKNQLKSLPPVGLSHRGSRDDTFVIREMRTPRCDVPTKND